MKVGGTKIYVIVSEFQGHVILNRHSVKAHYNNRGVLFSTRVLFSVEGSILYVFIYTRGD